MRQPKVGDLIVVLPNNDYGTTHTMGDEIPEFYFATGHIARIYEVDDDTDVGATFEGFNNSFVRTHGNWWVGKQGRGWKFYRGVKYK